MLPAKLHKPRKYSEEHFQVKPSSIPGIGLGLFTKVALKKGDTIGHYQGKILNDKLANSNQYIGSLYLLWVCKDFWIYGEGKEANYTRYMNHSIRPNIQLITSFRWKTARFAALKKIQPGEELFFNYGDEYWENVDFKPKEKSPAK